MDREAGFRTSTAQMELELGLSLAIISIFFLVKYLQNRYSINSIFNQQIKGKMDSTSKYCRLIENSYMPTGFCTHSKILSLKRVTNHIKNHWQNETHFNKFWLNRKQLGRKSQINRVMHTYNIWKELPVKSTNHWQNESRSRICGLRQNSYQQN